MAAETTLQELLAELTEINRNATTGALDNAKRIRALNWSLGDLQNEADWEITRRTKEFSFIGGIYEYSLKNYIGSVCYDNNGSTEISDFKNPYDLRLVDDAHKIFAFRTPKEVRYHIQQTRSIREFAIDGDLIIINYPRKTSELIHDGDSLTANGTWSASSDAINLTIDEVEYKEGDGCLNFDVSAGTSLVLTNSSLSAVDLSDFKNKSHWTLLVYLPTITNFSSIAFKWGSSASAYWSKTETLPANKESLETGWNKFAFKWGDATETGSPDENAIDYLQITITYSSATTDTDFRIDDIRVSETQDMEFEYYSLAMVKQSGGSYQLEFNADSATMTDKLIGGNTLRNAVIEGATYRCFRMVGGKRERDETDAFMLYEKQKKACKTKIGHNLRKAMRQVIFMR